MNAHRLTIAAGSALLLCACVLGRSHDDSKHDTAVADRHPHTTILLAELPPASIVVPAIPPRVRTMLNSFPPPTNGWPTVTTRFTTDTARVGDEVEFVTVTWIPRELQDSLRHMPMITFPLFTGDSSRRTPQYWGLNRTINVGGQLFDMYASSLRVPTVRPGRIEATPVTLSYQVPRRPNFLPATEERIAVQSAPAVLVVRPE